MFPELVLLLEFVVYFRSVHGYNLVLFFHLLGHHCHLVIVVVPDCLQIGFSEVSHLDLQSFFFLVLGLFVFIPGLLQNPFLILTLLSEVIPPYPLLFQFLIQSIYFLSLRINNLHKPLSLTFQILHNLLVALLIGFELNLRCPVQVGSLKGEFVPELLLIAENLSFQLGDPGLQVLQVILLLDIGDQHLGVQNRNLIVLGIQLLLQGRTLPLQLMRGQLVQLLQILLH